MLPFLPHLSPTAPMFLLPIAFGISKAIEWWWAKQDSDPEPEYEETDCWRGFSRAKERHPVMGEMEVRRESS